MVRPAVYDWMYRTWAPWDSVGVRRDLTELLRRGDVSPRTHPRSIDLGCGTGANVVHLAGQGFDATGVDFSKVAIRKARARAQETGVPARFVVADLAAPVTVGVEGPYDFLTDFGTLDDLRGEARRSMAATITRLARQGSMFLEHCFFGETAELPLISFRGTSKLSHIAPGELEELFGDDWDVQPFAEYPEWRMATFLLTKR